MPTPLFPLTQPLFPGGRLALQIFEPRYLDMVGRAQREGRPFAVVRLLQGQEVQRPGHDGATFADEAFEAVGTLAHIVQLAQPAPGLLHLLARGGTRVRLARTARQPTGLWQAEVDPLADDLPCPVPTDLAPLAELLRRSGDFDEADAPGFDDCGWVANRLAERLPITPADRQRLLEQPSPLLRLDMVADHWQALTRQPPR